MGTHRSRLKKAGFVEKRTGKGAHVLRDAGVDSVGATSSRDTRGSSAANNHSRSAPFSTRAVCAPSFTSFPIDFVGWNHPIDRTSPCGSATAIVGVDIQPDKSHFLMTGSFVCGSALKGTVLA
jgi:hypothetical protein